MSKTSKIILVTIIATSILLGLGYAAIQNITLNISGTAAANPSQSNFKVRFVTDPAPTVSDSTYVTAGVTNDTNATINVSGLTSKGQLVSATYTVQNASTDLSADLSVATTNSNTEYFTIRSELEDTSLKAGEVTTVTVTIELTKTPISESVSSTVGVQLTAVPVEPGQEGTSGTTNDYSQTPDEDSSSSAITLATLTTSNIGDYVDLGNNYVGTTATTDDWRVVSINENGTITLLLSNPLANGNEIVNDSDASSLIESLSNTTYWTEYTNSISGAYAYGGLSSSELQSIFLQLGMDELIVGTTHNLTGNYDYNLYSSLFNPTYYLCLRDGNESDNTMYNFHAGSYVAQLNLNQQFLTSFILRPIVILPSTTEVNLVDGVWTVIQ